MIRVPDMVTPEYALLENHRDFSHIKELKFPRDATRLCFMTLEEKAVWYASQDPQDVIDLAGSKQFQVFWRRFYARPLKLKRGLYKLKFW